MHALAAAFALQAVPGAEEWDRWGAQDASERRGGSAGVVAAGEDAETPMIMYAVGAPQRDLVMQCQARSPQSLG